MNAVNKETLIAYAKQFAKDLNDSRIHIKENEIKQKFFFGIHIDNLNNNKNN